MPERLVIPGNRTYTAGRVRNLPAAEAPKGAQQRSRLAVLTTWVGFTALGALALLGRPSDSSQRLSLWGEDGVIFMEQPRTLGIVRSLTRTYVGYLHAYPRAVGALAAALPITWTPIIFLLSAIACASFCAVIAWASGRALGLSPVNAGLLAVWILLAPAAGFEVVNTLTNVQWFILPTAIVFVAAWASGYRPPTVLACLLLGVAILTSPLVAIVLPIAIVIGLVRREPHDISLAVVLGLGATVQALARIISGGGSHQGAVSPAQFARWYAVRVIAASFLGSRLNHLYYLAVTSSGALAIALGILIVLVLLSLYSNPPLRRSICMGLLVGSVVLLAGTMVFRSDAFQLFPNVGFANGSPVAGGGRYVAGPAVGIFLVALLCLESWRRRLGSASSLVMFDLVSALTAVLLVMNFPVDLQRSPSASWTSQVRQERKVCESHTNSGPVRLVNSPGGGWVAVMTCRQAFG